MDEGDPARATAASLGDSFSARIAVVVLNYCTPDLALQAAKSAAADLDSDRDVVLIVDNDSPDDSAERIAGEVGSLGLVNLRFVRSPRNGGFAAGNNVGIKCVDAKAYVLLNSDTIVRPGTFGPLFELLTSEEGIGIVSPQLCGEDDRPQVSCFRFMSLGSEFLRGASTNLLTRMLRKYDIPLGVQTSVVDVPWTSFACVMIARETLDKVGLLDEGFFMYFEDSDYCRMVSEAGLRVVHQPRGRVVHLRGKSSPVKEAGRLGKRRPAYFYEARARYFKKRYGPLGLILANLSWTLGLALVLPRHLIGEKRLTLVQDEFLDSWKVAGASKEART